MMTVNTTIHTPACEEIACYGEHRKGLDGKVWLVWVFEDGREVGDKELRAWCSAHLDSPWCDYRLGPMIQVRHTSAWAAAHPKLPRTETSSLEKKPAYKFRIEQAEPGEGYRLLKLHEVIERTDEVWNNRSGWTMSSAKVGKPLLSHWRPRRRKLKEVVKFPLYWDRNGSIFRALDENCVGFFWVKRTSSWCRCIDKTTMVEHVKEWPTTYRPITQEEACDIIDEKAFEVVKLYDELLYAIASKYPGETRHQTALRYIQEAESRATASIEALVK